MIVKNMNKKYDIFNFPFFEYDKSKKIKLRESFKSIVNGKYGEEVSDTSLNIVNVFTLNHFSNNKKEGLIKRDIPLNHLKNKILEYGDIVIERSGGGVNHFVGRCFMFDLHTNDIYTSVDFTRIIKLDKENYNPNYIEFLLKFMNKNGLMEKFAQKTTKISNLKSSFFDIELHFPSKEKQSKIAEILSSHTNQISKIKELLEKIKIRNQYYADKILSGELRLNKNILELKHNEDYEYEKLKISDICEISTGKKDANEGSEDGIYEFFTCSLENKKINSYSYDEEAILITGNGDPGVCKYFNGKFDAYQRVYILRNIKINPKYFYCVLRSYFKDSIQNSKVGGVIQYIRLNDISDFEFRYPKNYDINKILVFLDKLNDEKEKVEKLLKLEQQRFEWLSDKLLSGEYIIED